MERMKLATGTCRAVTDWRNYGLATGSRDLLVLQRDRSYTRELVESLGADGWKPHICTDRGDAIRQLKLKDIYVGLVLIASDFSEAEQNELLDVIGQSPATEWIAIVDPVFVDAVEHAAFLSGFFFDFHTAPIDHTRLSFSLGHAYGAAKLAEAGRREFRVSVHAKFGLIGSSRAMLRVFSDMEKIARSDEPVIIGGETGTGKELIARAIHGASRRAAKPFVVVNCGAIPDTLVQSELFGHSKGAFTGASDARIGYLEAASGGTLFLDGIEDLSHLGQVSLLRFLQEKRVTRLAARDSVPVDVRVIASASPELPHSVAQGTVREDLFYRLNVLQIDAPPLRDRGADAVELAEFVIDRFNRERRRDVKRLSRKAIDRLLDYPWPGNVRELMSCVNRAAVLSNARLITPDDLGLPGVVKFTGRTLREIKSHAVEQALIWALTETKNISSAARQLGVSRVTLYRLMEKHSIRVPSLQQAAEAGELPAAREA
jgi:DNA-binding NtrC family response regulator